LFAAPFDLGAPLDPPLVSPRASGSSRPSPAPSCDLPPPTLWDEADIFADPNLIEYSVDGD